MIAERPIGEMHSSPTVCRKYVTTSHAGDTGLSGVAFAAPHASTKKPIARPRSPSPAFTGIEGFACLESSQTHSHPEDRCQEDDEPRIDRLER